MISKIKTLEVTGGVSHISYLNELEEDVEYDITAPEKAAYTAAECEILDIVDWLNANTAAP